MYWSGPDTPQTPEEPLPAASHKPRDDIVLIELAGEELGDSGEDGPSSGWAGDETPGLTSTGTALIRTPFEPLQIVSKTRRAKLEAP